MADVTTRWALTYPELADPADIDQAVRPLAEALDAVAMDDQGTFALRPAAGSYGSYYYATDQGILYRDNGTTWDTVGGPSAVLSTGSVDTSEIADDAVTADKLRDSAVTDGDRAVTTDHIRDVAVTQAKIALQAVAAAQISNTLKPSAGAGTGTEALRALGTGANEATAGNDGRIPTQAENDALQGTSGAPSNTNRYVTNNDADIARRATANVFAALATFNAGKSNDEQLFTTTGTILDTGGDLVRYLGGASQTLTLPALSLSRGRTFFIVNQGSTLTVQRAGADTINANYGNATSVTVRTGEMLIVSGHETGTSWTVGLATEPNTIGLLNLANTWIDNNTFNANVSIAAAGTLTTSGPHVSNSGIRHDEQQFATTNGLMSGVSNTAGDNIQMQTTTGGTMQLPTIATANRGRRFMFMNKGDAIVTISRGSTDTIAAGDDTVTSFRIAPGDIALLISPESGSTWAAAILPGPQGILTEEQTFTGSGTVDELGGDEIAYTGTGGHTLTLTAISVANRGRRRMFKNQGTGTVVVSRGSTDTINGGTSITLRPGESGLLVAPETGTNWSARIMQADPPGTYTAAMYLANSGAPTNTSNGAYQAVAAGGGTDTWVAEADIRPSGVTAQCDTTTNTAKLTCRKDGLYQINAHVNFSTIAADKVSALGVWKNGAQWASASDSVGSGGASGSAIGFSTVAPLVAGDTLELYAFQNDSASEAYQTALSEGNKISMTYIGPAT